MVVIYESGSAVLKVELGTTLEVMRLLYESEQNFPSDRIIGVRPRVNAGIPCIVTLNESKLEESSYDVILKESRSGEKISPRESDTTRCIDCSQESWKSKRFSSIGMNTEISINPTSEGDLPGKSTNDYVIKPRGRPPLQRPPVGVYPPASLPRDEYPKKMTSTEYVHQVRASTPSPTYGHTRICYPTENYENHQYRSRYDMLYESRRKHEMESPTKMRTSPTISYNRYLPYEKPSVVVKPEPHYEQRVPSLVNNNSTPATQQQPPENNNKDEREPPVYVLPNDFDSKNDVIDDHVISYRRSKEAIKREEEDRSSPSNGSDSGKSLGELETTNVLEPTARKLACKICKKLFPTKSTLYKHLRGHPSDEKPFKCNECGQGFTLSSNLRQHRIIHRGYKPFQCEYCGKKFMRSNVYKQHRRIHTGEQMHKCQQCPSEFLQRYALIKHLKKVHNIDVTDN